MVLLSKQQVIATTEYCDIGKGMSYPAGPYRVVTSHHPRPESSSDENAGGGQGGYPGAEIGCHGDDVMDGENGGGNDDGDRAGPQDLAAALDEPPKNVLFDNGIDKDPVEGAEDIGQG